MPAGDILTGYSFVPAEKNIDNTKLNSIVGQASIQPAFISAQTESTSSTTGDYYLLLKAGGTLAKIMSDNVASSLASSSGFQSQIWSTRLRSYNAVGNPNFEVDQRSVGNGTTIGTGGFALDRWTCGRAASTTIGGSLAQSPASIGGPVLPGTNFQVTNKILRFTLTNAQASLAAGDYVNINNTIEGSSARELIADVSSVSIMARCSVAPISFGLSLRDSPITKSLVKLCTISTANQWVVISLPNIPVFPAGNFTMVPGSVGYILTIALAAGSTYMTPANDVWQTGNYTGAVGQSNFGAQAVNSTIDFAFVQHEPGPQCTTLIDCPFAGPNGSLEACQRYFQKTYSYPTATGTANAVGYCGVIVPSYPLNYGTGQAFKKTMAKPPSVVIFNPATGASTSLYNGSTGTSQTVSAIGAVADSGFGYINTSANQAVGNLLQFHYTADSGW